MYGIFTYIYPKNAPNIGKYSIHGASGLEMSSSQLTKSIIFQRGRSTTKQFLLNPFVVAPFGQPPSRRGLTGYLTEEELEMLMTKVSSLVSW
jgi:hypothetical protein